MKKTVVLFLLVLGMIIPASAQKGKVTSALTYIESGNLEKAEPAIMGALDHDKTKDWPKTYYVLGRFYQAAYQTQADKYPDALLKTWENFKKAKSLDEKHRIDKIIDLQMPMLQNDFLSWAGTMFEEEKYNKAGEIFEVVMEINKSPIFNAAVDTTLFYNAGLSYYYGENYAKAVEFLQKSFDMTSKVEEGSMAAIMMHDSYLRMEDEDNAERIIVAGFEKYPDVADIMNTLLQYFLDRAMYDEAYDYIQIAKEKFPENHIYWYAEGLVFQQKFEKADDPDPEWAEKAKEAFTESIRLNDEFFNSQYNMGVLIFNEAVKMHTDANDIVDQEEYNKAIEKVNERFKKALPYMERAHEIMPEDIGTMETLKTLYYRLGMMEKMEEMEAKLKG